MEKKEKSSSKNEKPVQVVRKPSLLLRLLKSVSIPAIVLACIFLFSSQIPVVKINDLNCSKNEPFDLLKAWHKHYDRFFPTESAWEDMMSEKRLFLKEYSPNGEYGYDGRIDEIVAKELDRFSGNIYCDYTGAGVYQKRQLDEINKDLSNNMYGNAHSRNPSALNTEQVVEKTRERIAKFFNTNLNDYSVIFTSGATGSLKLVAESFPWTNSSRFVYLRSNHNSVLGIREVALDQGASFSAVTEDEILSHEGNCTVPGTSKKNVLTEFPHKVFNLFAYPAQDNSAGIKYPLDWINKVKKSCGNWITLLDAAAFVPCNSLNLTQYPADFVSISFYKMFGYPTGTGVLLVRNDVTRIMQKTFFGGGTVMSSLCDTHYCRLVNKPCQKFEDGTVSFLSIKELNYGLDVLEELTMDKITKHVWAITHYLYERLNDLKHSNNVNVVKIFGKHSLKDFKKQGSIINLVVYNPFGAVVGYHKIQDESSAYGIHLRTGCNCNPGALMTSLA